MYQINDDMDVNDKSNPTIDQAIQNMLVEATGGTVKNLDDLKGFVSNSQSLQAKITELEARTAIDPFSNEFVKNTNEFFSKGGTIDEFYGFLEVKKLDPEKMNPVDLVRYDYQNKYKGMTPQEIDSLIKRDVGNWEPTKTADGEIQPDPAVLADLKRRGFEAASKIKEQQAKLSTPAEAIRTKEAELRNQQIQTSMQSLVAFSVKDTTKIPISIKEKDKEVFAFEFELPQGFQQLAQQAVTPIAIEGFKKGELSINQAEFEAKTAPVLRDMAQKIAWLNYGPQIVEVAVRDAIAKTREAMARENAGMQVKSGYNSSPVEGTDFIKELKRREMGIVKK